MLTLIYWVKSLEIKEMKIRIFKYDNETINSGGLLWYFLLELSKIVFRYLSLSLVWIAKTVRFHVLLFFPISNTQLLTLFSVCFILLGVTIKRLLIELNTDRTNDIKRQYYPLLFVSQAPSTSITVIFCMLVL